jgi:dihydrofolate synthase / folylpolyglutamate synthase
LDGITLDYQAESLTVRNITLPLLGTYQAENAALAIAAASFLSKRDGFVFNQQQIVNGLRTVSVPARSEIIEIGGTPVIIDSAHNPQKLEAFFGLIQSLGLPKKPHVVFAAKTDQGLGVFSRYYY